MYAPCIATKVCFAGVDVAPDQGAEKCSSGKQRGRESKQPFYVDSMCLGKNPPSTESSNIQS